jgi:hypothetical protein
VSLYEILAVAALAAAGGFAWFLYRSDTRTGAAPRPENEGQPMFQRDRAKPTPTDAAE